MVGNDVVEDIIVTWHYSTKHIVRVVPSIVETVDNMLVHVDIDTIEISRLTTYFTFSR